MENFILCAVCQYFLVIPEAVTQSCSLQKGVLRSFTKFMLRPATLLKKVTLAKVFSFGFCEISNNAFFIEHLWTTASVILKPFTIETLKMVVSYSKAFIRKSSVKQPFWKSLQNSKGKQLCKSLFFKKSCK